MAYPYTQLGGISNQLNDARRQAQGAVAPAQRQAANAPGPDAQRAGYATQSDYLKDWARATGQGPAFGTPGGPQAPTGQVPGTYPTGSYGSVTGGGLAGPNVYGSDQATRHQQAIERRNQGSTAGGLVSGGGVATTPYGTGDPNALPMFDPYAPQVGLAGSYLNLMQMPSARGAQTGAALQGRVMGDLAAGAQNRGVPGMEQFQGRDQADRAWQQQAVGGVQSAGLDMAAMQRQLAQGALTRGAEAAGVQSNLMQQGGQVGAGAAGQQNDLMSMLRGQAAGTSGPTAAQALQQQGLDASIKQQMAAQSGVRGGSAAAAAAQAGRVGQDIAQQGVGQAAQLRAQEQQNAQALLGNVAAQARQGDVSTYGTRADVAAQARQGGLAEALGAGQLAGQTRGQDIGQAQTAADLISGLRGQDIASFQAQGALGLEGRSLDDAQAQRQIANAMGLYSAQLGAGQMDTQTLLQAAGLVQGGQMATRQYDLARSGQQASAPWWMGPAFAGGGAMVGATT